MPVRVMSTSDDSLVLHNHTGTGDLTNGPSLVLQIRFTGTVDAAQTYTADPGGDGFLFIFIVRKFQSPVSFLKETSKSR